MDSIAKNEFSVINFLVRNFYERFTIRNIAVKLKQSPAGVHSLLKKLEKNNIVRAEKLGTGLFYRINLDDKVGEHLASIVLLRFNAIKKLDIEKVKDDVKAVLFDNKNILFITENIEKVQTIASEVFNDYNNIVKTEEELIEDIRKKDALTLRIMKDANVVFGEDFFVKIIKKELRY